MKLASRTSEVASGAELAEVGLIVGYQPRANMWKQCFSIAAGDTRTSKTFHEQCDNMGPTMTLVTLQNGRRIAAYAYKIGRAHV